MVQDFSNRQKYRLIWVLLLAAQFVLFGPAFAQSDVVDWDIYTTKRSYESGEDVQLKFLAEIDYGWKMYALDSPAGKPLEIMLSELPSGFNLDGSWKQYDVREGFDPNFNTDVRYFQDSAMLDGTFRTISGVAGRAKRVEGSVTYMTCNDRMCLPPKKESFAVTFDLTAAQGQEDILDVQSESQRVTQTDANPSAILFEESESENAIETDQPPIIDWKVRSLNSSATAGGLLELSISADWEGNWKMYGPDSPAGRPLRIIPAPNAKWSIEGAIRGEGTRIMFDPNFQTDVVVWDQNARASAFIRLDDSINPGDQVVEGTLDYMVCSDRLCIPGKESFEVPFIVSTGEFTESEPIVPDFNEPIAEIRSVSNLDQARSGGFWAFLLLAMGAGLAALLTPCVFPMIPLTVSFFAKHGESYGRSIRMSFVYGLAIIATFTGLGILMALFVGASGAQSVAANPWVNLFIGGVFFVFAFSLLGLFELRLPNSLVNFFNRKGNESKGYVGVLFMGLTLTLVSFSCTVPFVGALLAATVDNEWTWPIIGMLVFSATFATPFVLFAMFPKWLNSLPKSGSWMNAVKVTLGFVELAAAFKFLSNADLVWGWNLLSRPLVISFCMVIFFLAGLYLIGKLSLPNDTPVKQIAIPRLMVAIGFFGLSFYMLPGLFGAPLNSLDAYLPPAQETDIRLTLANENTSGASEAGTLRWFSSHTMKADDARSQAFEQALSVGRPVLIDFTGYTCTNCRQMETNVFPRPEVTDLLANEFTLLQLYTDDDVEGEALQAYQLELTGTVALPTYAILNQEGSLLTQWNGLASTEEFVSFLENGLGQFKGLAVADGRDGR